MPGLRLVVVALVAACVNSRSVPCDDGRTCPEGTLCASLTAPDQLLCVTPEQIEACRGHDELAECALDGAALARCYQGVCLAAGRSGRSLSPKHRKAAGAITRACRPRMAEAC